MTETGRPAAPALSARAWLAQADFLVRQSEAVQLARVDAFLEGVILAAEQVQDTRIRLLETPEEVTGWQFCGDILLTFVLESTIAGKVLGTVSKKIFARPIQQNGVILALPPASGVGELRRGAGLLSGANVDPRRLRQVNAVTLAQARTAALAPLSGTSGPPTLRSVAGSGLKLYHSAIHGLASGGSETEQNLVAVAKAANEARTSKPITPRGVIAGGDSAGVAILSAAQDYASATRLGIRVRHARVSTLLASGDYTPAALMPIVEAFGWEDLMLDVNGRSVPCDLAQLRAEYALLFEAVIWARLYGFDPEQFRPHFFTNKDEFDEASGIRPELTNYWATRFGPSIEAWNAEARQNRGPFGAGGNRCRQIRDYFWAIVKALPRLRPGQLSAGVPVKNGSPAPESPPRHRLE